VNCKVHAIAIAVNVIVVTNSKMSVTSITNPNPICNQPYTWKHYLLQYRLGEEKATTVVLLDHNVASFVSKLVERFAYLHLRVKIRKSFFCLPPNRVSMPSSFSAVSIYLFRNLRGNFVQHPSHRTWFSSDIVIIALESITLSENFFENLYCISFMKRAI
jgi:hypothetical protein